ncbi:polyprenyl synthetase family protein [Salsuginibacillus kocurii]|uniref:polyprenyl synthetase family protein n=1 Tax=Salsuginibacillus kocurii TaxID=427078 RepID=UPI0003765D44|nr:farnesyl diphosphate synthase [Salsuginibacillus kocurii]
MKAYETVINRYKADIEAELHQIVNDQAVPEELLNAMLYSLKAGGKRIRPILLLAVCEGYDRVFSSAYQVAAAIEMIHTYSLIHDDLPAMDDDDLRRGQPTNHKVYGEAHAILAGDALLTKSFEVLATLPTEEVSSEVKLELIRLMAKAAGAAGMVGGQAADLEAENKAVQLDKLEYIHHHKTGDLFAYAVQAGAILAGAKKNDQLKLYRFAKELGLAFQIKDDILDVEGDVQVIGKPVGSDDGLNKSTYPGLLTLEGAKDKLAFHKQNAMKELDEIDTELKSLRHLALYIADRDR